MDEKPLISVVMITYNHERYIQEAINGVLMQNYQGKIELIVANDCSSDNTDSIIKSIIKEHPNGGWIKYTRNENNLGMMPNFFSALQQCKGKYIAFCEGDDYWTDPLKLQKQIFFLEDHPEFSFNCHRYKVYNEFSKTFDKKTRPLNFEKYESVNTGIVIDKNIYHKIWMTQPLTSVIRREFLIEIFKLKDHFVHFRDVHLFYLLLTYGNGFCMEFVGGVYRVHEGGIYSGIDKNKRYIHRLSIYKELYIFSRDKKFIEDFCKTLVVLFFKGNNIYSFIRLFFMELNGSGKIYFILIFFAAFYSVILLKLRVELYRLFQKVK